MGTKRKSRREDREPEGRRPIVRIVVVSLVLVALLAGGGFVAWRYLGRGGLSGPRSRLVGLWETDPQQPGNGGLQKGAKLIYEFKADGDFTSTLDQGGGLPNPPEPAKWEVKSESGNVLKLHMRRPTTESQRKNFGEDFNTYDLEVEILSDNRIRITSFKSMAAVREFDRKR
jgi:hypothetical protein